MPSKPDRRGASSASPGGQDKARRPDPASDQGAGLARGAPKPDTDAGAPVTGGPSLAPRRDAERDPDDNYGAGISGGRVGPEPSRDRRKGGDEPAKGADGPTDAAYVAWSDEEVGREGDGYRDAGALPREGGVAPPVGPEDARPPDDAEPQRRERDRRRGGEPGSGA